MTDNTDRRDESSLGDEGPDFVQAVSDAVVDTTPDVSADDFDFEAFLQGARPSHRSVRLYMRPDLVATMEELADRLQAAGDTIEDDDPLLAEFLATKQAFYASGRWFTLEGRSGEWIDATRKTMAAKYGLKVEKDGTLGEGKQRAEALQAIMVRLLAEQIVTPSNVTPEGLATLAERSPSEFRKLLAAQGIVNSSLAELAKVLTVDFSHAPSTATRNS